MKSMTRFQYFALAAALSASLIFSIPSFAKQGQIDRIVVFGTSLSDSGNAFVLLSDPSAFGFSETCIAEMGVPANVPPYDDLDYFLVPDGTYAKGGHHVSNGATWIEQLARGKGLSGTVRPALRSTGTQASNYAVGGARANEFDCRFNLADQIKEYQSDFPEAPPNTLFVIEMGSNDVQDALKAFLGGANPTPILTGAIIAIGEAIFKLYESGARKFLVANVPAVGITPAVRKLDAFVGPLPPLPPPFSDATSVTDLANQLSGMFDMGLAELIGNLTNLYPDIDIRLLDLYALLNAIVGNRELFDLKNIEDACIDPGKPPFKCKKPDTYLFWDGVHPTKAAHAIIAQEAAMVLQ